MANGVIKKGAGLPCPVDASGVFTEEVADFKSQYVKVSDWYFMLSINCFL